MLEVKIDKIIPAVEAKDNFDALLSEVESSDELYVLTKDGKPSAVLVGVHHLEKLTGTSHQELMDNEEETVDSRQSSVVSQEEDLPAPSVDSVPVDAAPAEETVIPVQSEDDALEEEPEPIDLSNFPDDSMAGTMEPDPLLPSAGSIMDEDMPEAPVAQDPMPSADNQQPTVSAPTIQAAPVGYSNQITGVVEGNTSGYALSQNQEAPAQQPMQANNDTSTAEPSILDQNTSVDNEDPLDFLSSLDSPTQNEESAMQQPAPTPVAPQVSAPVSTTTMPDEEMTSDDDFPLRPAPQVPIQAAAPIQGTPVQQPNMQYPPASQQQ